ncbi:hypothetical protein [Kaarinaea lacus]
MNNRMVVKSVIVALGITLLGCSSGGDSTPAAPATTTITGTVTAPGGAIATLEQKTFFAKFFNFVLPGAIAMITGTAPVSNATVELIKLDNDGNQTGNALTSAITDTAGNFSIETTEVLSAKLVLRVQGSGGATLRAMAVSSTVDIDPVSEYVLTQIENVISNQNASLANLTNSEIENFLSSVDMLNVDLTGMTMSGAMTALSNADGGNLIAAITADATLDLSGNWTYVETSGPNNCGDPVGQILDSLTLNVSHVGTTITVSYQGNVIAVGTLSGNSIVGFPLESGSDGEGSWVETSQSFTISNDGNTVNGTLNWTWTAFGGGFSCSGTDYAVMTRVQ